MNEHSRYLRAFDKQSAKSHRHNFFARHLRLFRGLTSRDATRFHHVSNRAVFGRRTLLSRFPSIFREFRRRNRFRNADRVAQILRVRCRADAFRKRGELWSASAVGLRWWSELKQKVSCVILLENRENSIKKRKTTSITN